MKIELVTINKVERIIENKLKRVYKEIEKLKDKISKLETKKETLYFEK